jgi:hypothetical protein
MLDGNEADPQREKKEARITGICLTGRAFDLESETYKEADGQECRS